MRLWSVRDCRIWSGSSRILLNCNRHVPFHYEMALGHDDDDPPPEEWDGKSGWPGKLGPRVSEINQRDFYRCWRD